MKILIILLVFFTSSKLFSSTDLCLGNKKKAIAKGKITKLKRFKYGESKDKLHWIKVKNNGKKFSIYQISNEPKKIQINDIIEVTVKCPAIFANEYIFLNWPREKPKKKKSHFLKIQQGLSSSKKRCYQSYNKAVEMINILKKDFVSSQEAKEIQKKYKTDVLMTIDCANSNQYPTEATTDNVYLFQKCYSYAGTGGREMYCNLGN